MTDSNNAPHLSRRMLLGGLAAAPIAALGATNLISAASAQTASPQMHPMAEFSRRTIGDIEVIALADGYTTLPLNLMPDLDQDKAGKIATQNYKTHNPQAMNTAINGSSSAPATARSPWMQVHRVSSRHQLAHGTIA